MSVSSVSGRIYTVKEIHATVNCFQNVRRGTNAHQVSRFVLRQMRNDFIKDSIHFLMSLTDSKSTHRIAIQIQF